MGTRTMGSQGGTLHRKSHAFARQSSLYNLTLDEVQHQLGDLGKPLSSMNLDELLKSVWSAETNENVVFAPGSVSLSLDLSKKTVDEVWRHIQQGREGNKRVESTLGEMTLEDFLVKAGVVSQYSPFQAQWMPCQQNQNGDMKSVYMPGQQIVEMVYPEQQMSLSDSATPGRKRVASGDVVEKIVERRQKRMIKNRESAARSRARKEAYTHELENKVSRLEEENERLKRMKSEDPVGDSVRTIVAAAAVSEIPSGTTARTTPGPKPVDDSAAPQSYDDFISLLSGAPGRPSHSLLTSPARIVSVEPSTLHQTPSTTTIATTLEAGGSSDSTADVEVVLETGVADDMDTGVADDTESVQLTEDDGQTKDPPSLLSSVDPSHEALALLEPHMCGDIGAIRSIGSSERLADISRLNLEVFAKVATFVEDIQVKYNNQIRRVEEARKEEAKAWARAKEMELVMLKQTEDIGGLRTMLAERTKEQIELQAAYDHFRTEREELRTAADTAVQERDEAKRKESDMAKRLRIAEHTLLKEREQFQSDLASQRLEAEASKRAALMEFTKVSLVRTNEVAAAYHIKGVRRDPFELPHPSFPPSSRPPTPTPSDQEVEKLLPLPTPEPKYQLRRTSSAPL